jgi:monoamine oxidase
MKRRLFIQSLPVFSALPSVLACEKDTPTNPDYDPSVETPDAMGTGTKTGSVIVVGAGAAGLYAGWLLQQKGLQVQILEAAATHGGRLRPLSNFADFSVELGAEEIHGSKSEFYRIAQAANARFGAKSDEDYYSLDGLLRSESQIANDADVKKAVAFVDNARDYAGTDQTVLAHQKAQGVADRTAHFVNAQIGNEYGTSNNRLSIKGIAEEDNLWSAGDDNFLVTNKSLLSCLESRVSAVLPLVKLNVEVQKIDYTNDLIVLTDQNNRTYSAQKIIIATPLSILKENRIRFTPTLPTSKTDSFNKIGFGAGLKIILKFSQAFWATDLGSLYGEVVPEYWFTSKGRGATNVLTAFVMGEKAEMLSAQGTAAVQTVVAELDKLYGNTVASRTLMASHIEDWSKNSFIRGAYSYPIVGGGIVQRQMLQKSVDKKLFWAGEATHSKGHSGTVHGAIESGIWAANAVFNAF